MEEMFRPFDWRGFDRMIRRYQEWFEDPGDIDIYEQQFSVVSHLQVNLQSRSVDARTWWCLVGIIIGIMVTEIANQFSGVVPW